MPDDLDDILAGKRALSFRQFDIQALVELVAAHVAQVIVRGVEEQVVYQLPGVFQVGRVAGAQFPVDIDEGVRFIFDGRLTLQRRLDIDMVRVNIVASKRLKSWSSEA